MDESVMSALETVASQAVSGSMESARLADIAQQFISLAGGSNGLAALLWKEYHHKDCSPYTRQRIVNMVLDAMKHTEKTQGELTPDALGKLSSDDLDRLIRQHLEAMARTVVQGKDGAVPPQSGVNPFAAT